MKQHLHCPSHSSDVTRESGRLEFIDAGLNGIDICAYDIGNAYPNAPCREKVWTEAGS